MKQEVLFLLLNEYADWEGAFLAISLNTGVIPGSEVKYIPKVVAPTLDVVRSVGGFRTLPDYSFQTMPADYAALVLVVVCTGNRLKQNRWCQLCRMHYSVAR